MGYPARRLHARYLESLHRGHVVCVTRPWIRRRPEAPGYHHSSLRLCSSAGHGVECSGGVLPSSPRTSRSATYLTCRSSSYDGGRAYSRGASPCPVGGISVSHFEVRHAATRATIFSIRARAALMATSRLNHVGHSECRVISSIATRWRCSFICRRIRRHSLPFGVFLQRLRCSRLISAGESGTIPVTLFTDAV
jgi:hypothetical protein